MNESQTDRVKAWLLTVVRDGSWQRYDDLHIDEISDDFAEQATWLNGGIAALNAATLLNESLALPFVIMLGIELRSSNKPLGINFKNRTELQEELGESPPSLYAFLPNWENWVETKQRSIPIDASALGLDTPNGLYYEYFSAEDMEYRRSLFVWMSPQRKNLS